MVKNKYYQIYFEAALNQKKLDLNLINQNYRLLLELDFGSIFQMLFLLYELEQHSDDDYFHLLNKEILVKLSFRYRAHGTIN